MSSVAAPPAPVADAPSPFATGPGTPAGRYLRAFWQPVRLSEDVPPGTAVPIKLLGEQFTLYRGENGQPQVLAPGCAHRLTALSVGTVEDDAIRCLFHGWKFGPTGQCLEAPGQSPGIVKRTSIRSYPTRDAFGLIFAYLGDGHEPRFPDIAAYSRAHGRDMTSAPVRENRGTYKRNCNYYINLENTLDLAHVPFTHRLSSDPTLTKAGFDPRVRELRDVTLERTDFGIKVVEVEEDGYATESTLLLPNVIHLLVGTREGTLEQMAWRVPIDDEQHMSYAISAIHTSEEGAQKYLERKAQEKKLLAQYPPSEECAEQVLRGEKTLHDFLGHPQLIAIEDHVAQMGMRFIADRGKEQLSRTDKGVVQMRRMFMSRMVDYLADDPTAAESW